jgi:hypothetical protein
MTILRQIKELKSEFATINAHVLRRAVQIHGGIPVVLDPKKPLRRTLLPGYLIIWGLPSTPSYEPDAGPDMPEQFAVEPEQMEDAIAWIPASL